MKTGRIYGYYIYYVGGAIILIVAILLLLSFNSENIAPNEEPGTIYFAGHISEAHRVVIDNFNKAQNGKIRVKTVDISFNKFNTDEHKELFARFLRSESDKIDVLLIDQIWVPRFAKWSEPLENYFNYSERNNIISQGLEACSDGRHLVGVPLYVDIAMMYYRKDLLEKIKDNDIIKKQLDESITWEDFIKLGEKLKTSGILKNGEQPFYIFQAKAFEGLMCSFMELMASQNMTLYKNKKLQINTPQAKKALQLLVDLVHKYRLSPAVVSDFEETQSYNYYLKNDGLFLRGWPNLSLHYTSGSPEEQKISNLVKTLPPHFKGQKKTFALGGWNMMISRFSKNKKESVEFIKYLLSAESQKTLYEKGNYIPSNTAVYEDKQYVAAHPELLFFRESLEKGFHRPFLKDYTKISGIITAYINLAISNRLSADEALSLAEDEINSDYFLIR